MLDEKATLTIREVALVLGVSEKSAYSAAARGELPVLRLGKRILVSKVGLDRMLEETAMR